MVAVAGFGAGFVPVRPHFGDRSCGDCVGPRPSTAAMATVRHRCMGRSQSNLARLSLSQRCRRRHGDGICGGIDLQRPAALVGPVMRTGPYPDCADGSTHHRSVLGVDASHCRSDDGWNPARVGGGAGGRRFGLATDATSEPGCGRRRRQPDIGSQSRGLGLGCCDSRAGGHRIGRPRLSGAMAGRFYKNGSLDSSPFMARRLSLCGGGHRGLSCDSGPQGARALAVKRECAGYSKSPHPVSDLECAPGASPPVPAHGSSIDWPAGCSRTVRARPDSPSFPTAAVPSAHSGAGSLCVPAGSGTA